MSRTSIALRLFLGRSVFGIVNYEYGSDHHAYTNVNRPTVEKSEHVLLRAQSAALASMVFMKSRIM